MKEQVEIGPRSRSLLAGTEGEIDIVKVRQDMAQSNCFL